MIVRHVDRLSLQNLTRVGIPLKRPFIFLRGFVWWRRYSTDTFLVSGIDIFLLWLVVAAWKFFARCQHIWVKEISKSSPFVSIFPHGGVKIIREPLLAELSRIWRKNKWWEVGGEIIWCMVRPDWDLHLREHIMLCRARIKSWFELRFRHVLICFMRKCIRKTWGGNCTVSHRSLNGKGILNRSVGRSIWPRCITRFGTGPWRITCGFRGCWTMNVNFPPLYWRLSSSSRIWIVPSFMTS